MERRFEPGRFLTLAAALALAAHVEAQVNVWEVGFVVTEIPTGPAFVETWQLECGAGGAWGDYLYAADIDGGTIQRVDLADDLTTFATGLTFPMGLAFGPGPAADFGDFLYVADEVAVRLDRVDAYGTVSPFVSGVGGRTCAFDPSGTYGTGLFVARSAIYEVDAQGSISTFTDLDTDNIEFGPGGAWGQGLYAASGGVVKVAPDGTSTPFAEPLFTSFGGFDWGFGPGWFGDMFVTEWADGLIVRVDATGATKIWAELPRAVDVAFCNGALYAVDTFGEAIYKITYAPSQAAFCDASDGSLVFCPCSNPGHADTGCDIPQATGGVGLSVLAQSSSPNRATVQGIGFSTMGSPTVIVIRSSLDNLASPVVFGDGIRCLDDTNGLVRLGQAVAVGGVSTHTLGNSAVAGAGIKHYQLWFRSNPSTYCDALAAFNLSNGRSLTW